LDKFAALAIFKTLFSFGFLEGSLPNLAAILISVANLIIDFCFLTFCLPFLYCTFLACE
jgi:hypothetical protein